jgi:hypothetical protein
MPKKIEFECLNCHIYKISYNTAGKYCSNKCQKEYEMLHAVSNNTASHKTVKRYLTEQKNECSVCGINSWNGKPIVLELEHKNGNHTDNSLENVCLICPNCHSQTDTYKNKNKGNGRHYRRVRYASGLSF